MRHGCGRYNGAQHLFEVQAVDGHPNRLPSAATCFNTLRLPRYVMNTATPSVQNTVRGSSRHSRECLFTHLEFVSFTTLTRREGGHNGCGEANETDLTAITCHAINTDLLTKRYTSEAQLRDRLMVAMAGARGFDEGAVAV